jgi:hypothetical protein
MFDAKIIFALTLNSNYDLEPVSNWWEVRILYLVNLGNLVSWNANFQVINQPLNASFPKQW